MAQDALLRNKLCMLFLHGGGVRSFVFPESMMKRNIMERVNQGRSAEAWLEPCHK